jgi:hypothetical protein
VIAQSRRLKTDVELTGFADYIGYYHLKGGSFRLTVIAISINVLARLGPPFIIVK